MLTSALQILSQAKEFFIPIKMLCLTFQIEQEADLQHVLDSQTSRYSICTF